MKKYFIILVSTLVIASCLRNDALNKPFVSFYPKSINDGTLLSLPSTQNIDSIGLFNIYQDVNEDDNLWSIRSMLVYRNGYLVAENYFKDESDLTTQHLIWSCTKQVMGALTGMAIDKGVFQSINDPISDYFTYELDNHADKADITIRELLTMNSAIDYENDGASGQTDKLLRQIPDNSVEFVLDRPLKSEKGFYYKDGDPHLLSALIQKQTGKTTDTWADEVLFSKIGLTNYSWDRYKDGVSLGGFGIITTPREMAKFALCIADSGNWGGQQIIPKSWIAEMTSSQIPTDFDYEFGYLWWIEPSRNIHFMWGHGGQFAFIVPDKDLVVVITSIPNTQGDYQIQADEALPIVDRIISISH